ELVAPFATEPSVQMTTLFRRINDAAELANPNIAKVVIDRGGFALYFSRAPIPYVRDPRGGWPPMYRHVGLYAYRRSALMGLGALEPTPLARGARPLMVRPARDPTPLERAEALKQLRALEHGIRIKTVETAYDSFGVD